MNLELNQALQERPAARARLRLRPMRADDIPQIESLFFAVFRGGRRASPDFRAYFARLFFDSADPSHPAGLVTLQEDGEICAAVTFLPMAFKANGRDLMARLACTFMVDPRFPDAAARLAMALRARHHDLLFSDSSSPISADYALACDGLVLPVESLDWHCRFRPIWAAWPGLARLDPVMGRLARRWRQGHDARPDHAVAELDAAGYAVLMPAMLERFSVRPHWAEDEVRRLLALAGENRNLGILRFFVVLDAKKQAVGCCAAYFDKRGRVRVLDLLALPRHETKVVTAFWAHLDRAGVVQASGMAHSHLISALSRQRGVSFWHRAFTCVATRHIDIRDAIGRNDVYIGGLAGEGWSRLMTDFHGA